MITPPKKNQKWGPHLRRRIWSEGDDTTWEEESEVLPFILFGWKKKWMLNNRFLFILSFTFVSYRACFIFMLILFLFWYYIYFFFQWFSCLFANVFFFNSFIFVAILSCILLGSPHILGKWPPKKKLKFFFFVKNVFWFSFVFLGVSPRCGQAITPIGVCLLLSNLP